MEPTLRTEAVGERGVSRPRHEQAHAVAEPQLVVLLDDELMPQGTQHLRLRLEAAVALGIQRHLEHLLPSISLDEERQRRGPLAEPPPDDQPMLDLVPRTRIERVRPRTFLRTGDLLLEVFEIVEELADRFEARRHFRVRRVLHEKLQVLAGAVQDGGELQALFPPEPLRHLQQAGRGGSAREEVIGDGAEREDVELLPGGGSLGHRLRRHVHPGLVLDQRVEPRGSRSGRSNRAAVGRLTRPGLPVEDLDARQRRPRIEHEDALRRERTVDQVFPVRIADRLRDLPQEVDARVDVETRPRLGEPVIEALGARAVLEHQRGTEDVPRCLGRNDAVVAHVQQDLVLPSGSALQGCSVVVCSAVGNAVDSDSRFLSLDRDVLRRPILVARTLEQQLLEPIVSNPPRTLRRANTRLLHCAAERLGHRTVGARAVYGAAALRVSAAMMPGRSSRPLPRSRTCTQSRRSSGRRQSTSSADRKT